MTATVEPLTRHPARPCREYRGPTQPGNGYGRIRTGGRQIGLHRWIVETVEGRPLGPGELVMHTCDNPPCFLYEHLRRGTYRENALDSVAKGRHRFVAHRGEANGGGGKLTEADVRSIRSRHVPGTGRANRGNTRALADEFGVGTTMITKIVRGQAWSHIR